MTSPILRPGRVDAAIVQVDEANLTGIEDANWAHEPINHVLSGVREKACTCFGNTA